MDKKTLHRGEKMLKEMLKDKKKLRIIGIIAAMVIIVVVAIVVIVSNNKNKGKDKLENEVTESKEEVIYETYLAAYGDTSSYIAINGSLKKKSNKMIGYLETDKKFAKQIIKNSLVYTYVSTLFDEKQVYGRVGGVKIKDDKLIVGVIFNEVFADGDEYQVNIVTKKGTKAVYVESDAIIEKEGKTVVYKYLKGKPVETPVKTGGTFTYTAYGSTVKFTVLLGKTVADGDELCKMTK